MDHVLYQELLERSGCLDVNWTAYVNNEGLLCDSNARPETYDLPTDSEGDAGVVAREYAQFARSLGATCVVHSHALLCEADGSVCVKDRWAHVTIGTFEVDAAGDEVYRPIATRLDREHPVIQRIEQDQLYTTLL